MSSYVQIERLSPEQAKLLDSMDWWVERFKDIQRDAHGDPENPLWIKKNFVGTCLAAAKALNGWDGEDSESEHKK